MKRKREWNTMRIYRFFEQKYVLISFMFISFNRNLKTETILESRPELKVGAVP